MYVYVYINSAKSRIDEKRQNKMVKKLKKIRKPEHLKKERVNMTLAKDTLEKLDQYITYWNKTNLIKQTNRSDFIDRLVRDKLKDPLELLKKKRLEAWTKFIATEEEIKKVAEEQIKEGVITKEYYEKHIRSSILK